MFSIQRIEKLYNTTTQEIWGGVLISECSNSRHIGGGGGENKKEEGKGL